MHHAGTTNDLYEIATRAKLESKGLWQWAAPQNKLMEFAKKMGEIWGDD